MVELLSFLKRVFTIRPDIMKKKIKAINKQISGSSSLNFSEGLPESSRDLILLKA